MYVSMSDKKEGKGLTDFFLYIILSIPPAYRNALLFLFLLDGARLDQRDDAPDQARANTATDRGKYSD